MDRRSLIRMMLGLGAGALVGLTPSVASTLVIGDRYKRLIATLADLQQAKLLAGDRWTDNSYHAAMGTFHKTNAALAVLVEEFGDMTPLKLDYYNTMYRVHEILTDRLKIDVMSEDDLRRYEDVLVAVGVVRYMLATIKVPIADRNIVGANLTVICRRYTDLINERARPGDSGLPVAYMEKRHAEKLVA